MVDLRIGKKFQMIRKIGSGAFGEIFEGIYLLNSAFVLGKNIKTDELVAIKLVRPISKVTLSGASKMLISTTRV